MVGSIFGGRAARCSDFIMSVSTQSNPTDYRAICCCCCCAIIFWWVCCFCYSLREAWSSWSGTPPKWALYVHLVKLVKIFFELVSSLLAGTINWLAAAIINDRSDSRQLASDWKVFWAFISSCCGLCCSFLFLLVTLQNNMTLGWSWWRDDSDKGFYLVYAESSRSWRNCDLEFKHC